MLGTQLKQGKKSSFYFCPYDDFLKGYKLGPGGALAYAKMEATSSDCPAGK